MPLQYMACAEAQARIGLAARKEGSKARDLIGMPVGQVVGRMTQALDVGERMKVVAPVEFLPNGG